MLVGFSSFCGFVCCKFQYINPRPLPESLSSFWHQKYCSFTLAGGEAGAGINSPLQPSPAMPSRMPNPARAPPRSPRAYLCEEKYRPLAGAIPELAGAEPGQPPSCGSRTWAPGRLQSGPQAAQPGSRSAGEAEGAAMSPWHRSGLQRVRGGQSAPRGERGEPGRHSRNNWRELLINLIITLSCVNTLHMQKWLKSAN